MDPVIAWLLTAMLSAPLFSIANKLRRIAEILLSIDATLADWDASENMREASALTEGRISKGGHNPPNTSTLRPPAPQGSGGGERIEL
jgi:hypothetical protein